MFMAFIYWEVKVNHGVQPLVAFAITVLVAAPLLGAFIERILMRRLADAPLVAQLVVTIGLMLFLMGLAVDIWDPNSLTRQHRRRSSARPASTRADVHPVVPVHHDRHRRSRSRCCLRLLLYRSRLGVSMRAVVDNRDLAALNGARPGRMSQFAWALGIVDGGDRRHLPRRGAQHPQRRDAHAVHRRRVRGRDHRPAARAFRSTYVGGMIIGLSIAFQQNFLTGRAAGARRRSRSPTIILFLALLFLPQARIEGAAHRAARSRRASRRCDAPRAGCSCCSASC